ncbi:protein of unknown function [Methanoculleus bourgensis]|uniref:Uncharacterized protein n=1 Tax=Methanoculleus bourgensis TaxID=83986 RepID=A0A0X3BN68_9EURY|nr:protein of unknown function [Methanoculleus bourgensis]
MSRDLIKALKAMGYADTGIPALAESFPPAVINYLRDFRTQEVHDIIETLLYIYIAQNSSSSRGRGKAWSKRVVTRIHRDRSSRSGKSASSTPSPGTARRSSRRPRQGGDRAAADGGPAPGAGYPEPGPRDPRGRPGPPCGDREGVIRQQDPPVHAPPNRRDVHRFSAQQQPRALRGV